MVNSSDTTSAPPTEVWIKAKVKMRGLVWHAPGSAGAGQFASANGQWANPSPDHDDRLASPIVFLHGLGDGADIWRPVLDHWPVHTDQTVIALDLPGHGGSDRLGADGYTVATMAKAIREAISALDLHRPIIVGHSFGGRLAVRLVAQGLHASRLKLIDMGISDRPDVDTLIAAHIDRLIDGKPTLELFSKMVAGALPLADADVLRSALAHMANASANTPKTKPEPAPRPASPPHTALPLDPGIKALLTKDRATQTFNELSCVQVPVSVFRGAYSSVLSPQDVKRIEAALPRCLGVYTVPKTGHAIALEQPAALADCLAVALQRA